MKTFIIWFILFTALIGTTLYLVSQRVGFRNPFVAENSTKDPAVTIPMTFDQAIVYTCADGSIVGAAFKTGDTSVVEVSLPQTNPLTMTQVEVASGARYVHESGFAFWEKSGTVLVEKDGEVVYTDCKVGQVVPAPETATPTNELAGTQWVWTQTSFATASSVKPNKPEDFVITFSENNRFTANTDCNNVGGNYVGGTAGAVSFREMVSTLMACAGDTKEAMFVEQLGAVVSYKINDTALIFSLKTDTVSGEIEFTKK